MSLTRRDFLRIMTTATAVGLAENLGISNLESQDLKDYLREILYYKVLELPISSTNLNPNIPLLEAYFEGDEQFKEWIRDFGILLKNNLYGSSSTGITSDSTVNKYEIRQNGTVQRDEQGDTNPSTTSLLTQRTMNVVNGSGLNNVAQHYLKEIQTNWEGSEQEFGYVLSLVANILSSSLDDYSEQQLDSSISSLKVTSTRLGNIENILNLNHLEEGITSYYKQIITTKHDADGNYIASKVDLVEIRKPEYLPMDLVDPSFPLLLRAQYTDANGIKPIDIGQYNGRQTLEIGDTAGLNKGNGNIILDKNDLIFAIDVVLANGNFKQIIIHASSGFILKKGYISNGNNNQTQPTRQPTPNSGNQGGSSGVNNGSNNVDGNGGGGGNPGGNPTTQPTQPNNNIPNDPGMPTQAPTQPNNIPNDPGIPTQAPSQPTAVPTTNNIGDGGGI